MSTLLVLGMHRSGTIAITGSLGISGAWVGEEAELTSPNAQNPLGFWERRDVRRLCDQLLHSAGADWWKIADFDPQAIPRATLTEQRRQFQKIVSSLEEYETWIVKEPRLCLLLPALKDHIRNPVCIHIYRNPLEVARSLQTRDGFSIAAGLALWEAYNLHALNASRGLQRLLIYHKSLISRPVETLNALVEEFEELGLNHSIDPDAGLVERFIDSGLHHQQATDDETDNYLLPSQQALWSRFRRGTVFDDDNTEISEATRRQLLDLESTQLAFARQQDETNRLAIDLRARDRTLHKLKAGMESRAATIRARAATIRARDKTINEINARLADRARTIQANERTISALNAGMESRAATIRARDETIAKLNISLESRARAIQTRDKTIEARNRTIEDLHNSTSWKVTRPLRAMSRSVNWFAKSFRATSGRAIQSDTNQTARAIEPQRDAPKDSNLEAGALSEDRQAAAADRLAKLIRDCRESRPSKPARRISGKMRVGVESRRKITVIAWDLGHNPLGRTYLLADVLRNDYDVELLGANFPRFGSEVWKPLRTCSRVTMKSFPGANFPEHFNRMEDVARQIDGDVIYVSKPRLPGLELAILAKMQRNRPVILDVDDHELGFFRNRRPLTLDEVKAQSQTQDFKCPHDEVWTRYSESLIPLFDQVTVSGEELRKKFGGLVLPHIRDEYDFDPAAYPRDRLRAELGFTPENKVVLFVGTPRMHKGVARIYAALKKLNRPDYKLAVVGTPVDREARRFFRKCSPGEVTVLPDTPFSDLPGYLCIGDLICLIQAEDSDVSLYQTPAKFTDGLSMGIPMLASNVPPLQNLARKGLVELLSDSPLERKIDQIFGNYNAYKRKAMQNRELYLREYSYGAHLPELQRVISRLLDNPSPIPDAFHELVAYHRERFSDAARLPRVTARIVVDRRPDGIANLTSPSWQDPVPVSIKQPLPESRTQMRCLSGHDSGAP